MIDSPANPTVKSLRALTTAKGRRESRRFLVEGVRAVEEGLRASYPPDICLYNSELLGRTERGSKLLRELLAGQGERKTVLAEASPRAIEAASDTLHPQGIVAAFPFVEWREPAPPTKRAALALVCDDIQDPGNLGTILRTAEAAGVDAVWLTPRCVDLYNPKVVRSAMGAHFRLPAYPDRDWERIGRDLEKLQIDRGQIFATQASADEAYDQADWRQPSALIVSNEAHGLSAEAARFVEQGGRAISIPMEGGTESLNAAIAAAIILFEAARQRRKLRQGT